MDNLKEEVQNSLPCWESSNASLLGVNGIPVNFTSSSVKINITRFDEK